jgi:hypothetical protein
MFLFIEPPCTVEVVLIRYITKKVHSVAQWLRMRRVSKKAFADGRRIETSCSKLAKKFSKINKLLL